MIFNLFGCGKVKYNVTAESGYELKKTSYAYKDTVEAIYGLIATDTNYSFYADSPDVKVKSSYEEGKGYVITFTMPEHDVKLMVSMRNTMEYEEDAQEPDIQECFKSAKVIFDYYDTSVATEAGSNSTEYVLYDYGNCGRYILAKIVKKVGEETGELCWTTDTLYTKCLELVEKYDMRHWKNETSLEGAKYVVRIAYGQELLRISSDEMPMDGEKAFMEISQYLAKAWSLYRGMMEDE